MRRLFSLVVPLVMCSLAFAQQQGTVVYDRVVQMQINVEEGDGLSQSMPKTKTDKFQLVFGNNQSIYKHVDDESNGDET
ncbi:MAG TPA: hypothetical protein VGC95_00540, partial [Chitinophagaceae bacterium]